MGMSGRWSDLFRGRPQPRQHAAYGEDGLMRRAPDLEQRMNDLQISTFPKKRICDRTTDDHAQTAVRRS